MIIGIIKIAYSLLSFNNVKLVLGIATPQNIITISTIYQTTRFLIKIMEIIELIDGFRNRNKNKMKKTY